MSVLASWWTEFISELRQQYEHLSNEQKPYVTNLDDFLVPCQVECVHFTNPVLQLVIVTHFANRQDKEITVHGPTPAYNYVDALETLLDNPKWEVPLTEQERRFVLAAKTFRELIEGTLIQAASWVRHSALVKPPEKPIIGTQFMITMRSFIWLAYGDLSESDAKSHASAIIQKAKDSEAKARQVPQKAQPAPPRVKGFGSHFYPPIRIGELPRMPLRARLAGLQSHFGFFNTKALDTMLNDKCIIVTLDGFIAVAGEDRAVALSELNIIMATALLQGISAFAVQDPELAEVKIDTERKEITESLGSPLVSMRTLMGFEPVVQTSSLMEHVRTRLSPDQMFAVIQRAGAVAKDPELADSLASLLQGWTHFSQAEYSQSFIMSWLTVERCLFRIWNAFLAEERVDENRRRKLGNSALWTIDSVLETLTLAQKLGKEEYEQIAPLRRIRNRLVHKGRHVTETEAKACFEFGLRFLRDQYEVIQQ